MNYEPGITNLESGIQNREFWKEFLNHSVNLKLYFKFTCIFKTGNSLIGVKARISC
jgi:hypothetical protein